MSYVEEFVCDGCGLRAAAKNGRNDRHTGHKEGPLKHWWHVDRMGSSAHLLHFCSPDCILQWAGKQVAHRDATIT